MYHVFLDFVLPFLVVGSLLGFWSFCLSGKWMYDYLVENYEDALPVQTLDYTGMGYLNALYEVARSGEWRRIDERYWRRFFIATMSCGLLMASCGTLLCISFVLKLL